MGSDVEWLERLLWATEHALRHQWDGEAGDGGLAGRNRLIADLEGFRTSLLTRLGTRAA